MDESTEIIRALFEEHADALYRYARYSLPPDIDAKDVVQEVFLRAFRKWEEFKGNASAQTWLFRIARNYMVDLLRKRHRERVYQASMPYARGAVPLNTLIEIEEALQNLSFSHRQILNLRSVQGMSVAETADVLGWTESKVRVTYHRARKKLKEHLEDSPNEFLDVEANRGGTAHGK